MMTKFTKEQLEYLDKNITMIVNGCGILHVGGDVFGNVRGNVGTVGGDVRGTIKGSVWQNIGGDVWGTVRGTIDGSQWQYVEDTEETEDK